MADNKIEHFISCGHLNTFGNYCNPLADDTLWWWWWWWWWLSVRHWSAPISHPFTYLAAVCICAIIPALEGSLRANMHLTFGIEDDNSIRREFDGSIKKRNAFHNTYFDAARCFWSILSPNWGHEWAVNKDFDGVPHGMEVEVKPFFSLFNSHSYGPLIGYAW